MKNLLGSLLLGAGLAAVAAAQAPSDAKVVFYLPFEESLVARTPLMEVAPSAGVVSIEDQSQSVTIGELVTGKDIKVGGGEIDEKSARIRFVAGLSGKAAQLGEVVTYSVPWLREMGEGTLVLWYRNPTWKVKAWCIPAMLTPAQNNRSKPAAFQTPLSHWIFDRMTSPPEQGKSTWFEWEIVNNEHPRNLTPRAEHDNAWHCWALRWKWDGHLIEVLDDGEVRDIGKYPNRILPGKDSWDDLYMGRTSRVYEDPGHVNFDEIFLGELHLARFCEVALDEVYVWDRALPREEIKAAVQRAIKGQPAWPATALPVPKYRADEGLDLKTLPAERPALPPQVRWGEEGAVIGKNSRRHSVCLNGYWRFQPTANRFTAPDPAGWGYARLPGPVLDQPSGRAARRAGGSARNAKNDSAKSFRQAGKCFAVDGAFQPVADGSFGGKEIADCDALWFERDVEVPAAQKGWRFFLRFDRVDSRQPFMDVYVNGSHAARLHSYGPGRLDVTRWVIPGANNRIALAVEGQAALWFDWYLEARRLDTVSVHDPYVWAQWRKKAVAVRFDLENHTDQPQTYSYGVDFFEADTGNKVHSLAGRKITLAPRAKAEEHVEGPWESPRCWSVYDPFLHTVEVVVRNALGLEVDRGLPVRFGYRELWAENGQIYVNGSQFHNRGIGQSCGNIGYEKALDYSDLYNEALTFFSMHKGVFTFVKREINRAGADAVLDAADRIGFFAAPIEHGTGFYADQTWDGNRREQAANVARVRWLRNHPSLFAHIVRQTANYEQKEGIGGGSAEVKLWRDKFEQDASWLPYQEVWDRFVAPMRRENPGAFYTCVWLPYGEQIGHRLGKHGYGLPLQSQEEEPRFYAGHGTASYNAETGWPQISRNFGDVTGVDDLPVHYNEYWPNFSQTTDEFAAIYLGDRAYDTEVEIRDAMGSAWKPDADGLVRFSFEYVKDIETVGRPFSRKSMGYRASPGWVALRQLFMKQMMATWRWYGYGWWEHTETSEYIRASEFGKPPVGSPKRDTKELTLVDRAALRGPGIALGEPGKIPAVKKVFARPQELVETVIPSEIGKTARAGQQPLVAWIYGAPDIARKDHAFFSGEKIRKQVGVINEYPRPVKAVVVWRARREGGPVLAEGRIETAFASGAQSLHPVEFPAPAVEAKTRCVLEIETSLDGKKFHGDRFPFQVFPPHRPSPMEARIALIDSEATGSMLRIAGVSSTPVSASTDLSKFDLLIIGRQCDHAKVRALLKKLDVRRHLEDGLNLLVFEQEGEVLERPTPDPWPDLNLKKRPDRPELVSFGLRLEHAGIRNAFIREAGHPLFKDLADEDFANWRGASNLLAPWNSPKWSGSLPTGTRSWREPQMSNLGEVATFVFNKPQGGNVTSLMDASFDLLYSPLIEERRTKGRVIFCQLNVTNRYKADPVATLFVDRLLRYAASKAEGLRGTAVFAGSDAWRKTLEHLPFVFRSVEGGAGLKEATMLVAGVGTPHVDDFDQKNQFVGTQAAPAKEDDRAWRWLMDHKQAVADFAREGGAVLVLPAADAKDLAWLPFPVTLNPCPYFAAKPRGVVPGIGPSDLYWRRAVELVLPTGLPEGLRATSPAVVARVPFGKGEFILCQVHPKRFYGNWAESKILRLYSAILTEKGVADRLDLDPTQSGYQEGGFPYFEKTLWFDPFISTSW